MNNKKYKMVKNQTGSKRNIMDDKQNWMLDQEPGS